MQSSELAVLFEQHCAKTDFFQRTMAFLTSLSVFLLLSISTPSPPSINAKRTYRYPEEPTTKGREHQNRPSLPTLPPNRPTFPPNRPTLPPNRPTLPPKRPTLPPNFPTLPSKRPSLPTHPPRGPFLPTLPPSHSTLTPRIP